MKILSVVGTRPELVKTVAFTERTSLFPDLELVVAHSGQNFGENMADNIIRELPLDVYRNPRAVDRTSRGTIAQSLIDFTDHCVDKFKPDVVVSNTDTDTAFYVALACAKRRVRVAHIEGGIRCEARLNPEELNRKLADHLANWVFTISDEDTQDLLREGFPADRVFNLGDITYDALRIVMASQSIRVSNGGYNLLTIHRQENANDPERLGAILSAVEESGVPTKFIIHPRTKGTLEAAGLLKVLAGSRHITALDAQPLREMLTLLAGANKVISDSGGLRREAYLLGKPVISLVSFCWFKRMAQLGFEFMADADPEKISWAIAHYAPAEVRPPLFGDGKAGEYILRKLVDVGGV